VTAGFEDFYTVQFDLQVGRVLKKVDNRHDAEEIIQDSLFDLYRAWDTVETPEALLATIIKRKIIKYWGRRPSAKGAIVIALGEETDRIPDRIADPAVTVEQRDTIRRAAEVMDPIERQVVMGRVNQHSSAAIAARAGVSASEVRQAGSRMAQRMAASEVNPLETLDLEKYAARLPSRQQAVMSLAFGGYRPAVIAGHLDITPNDARVNLCHAKKALVDMLPDSADPKRRVDLLLRDLRRRRDLGLMPFDVKRVVPNRPRYPRSDCQICEDTGARHGR
jgi:DNA-directed RNA polymerase specialized sigma24 family protein